MSYIEGHDGEIYYTHNPGQPYGYGILPQPSYNNNNNYYYNDNVNWKKYTLRELCCTIL
jgi:hypothetical protein